MKLNFSIGDEVTIIDGHGYMEKTIIKEVKQKYDEETGDPSYIVYITKEGYQFHAETFKSITPPLKARILIDNIFNLEKMKEQITRHNITLVNDNLLFPIELEAKEFLKWSLQNSINKEQDFTMGIYYGYYLGWKEHEQHLKDIPVWLKGEDSV